MKQDSVVTIYLRMFLSRTTLLKSFLRDSGMNSSDNGMTCNQLLVKISIFILIIIILRQRDKPVAHEVKIGALVTALRTLLVWSWKHSQRTFQPFFRSFSDRGLNASTHYLLTHCPYNNF